MSLARPEADLGDYGDSEFRVITGYVHCLRLLYFRLQRVTRALSGRFTVHHPVTQRLPTTSFTSSKKESSVTGKLLVDVIILILKHFHVVVGLGDELRHRPVL